MTHYAARELAAVQPCISQMAPRRWARDLRMTPVIQGLPANSCSSEGGGRMGDCQKCDLRGDFDRTVRLTFAGSKVTCDAGLLAYRELDEVLALTATAGRRLEDSRTGRNTHHALLPLIRQSIYSRMAGYEDVNDAERLLVDQAYRTSWAAAPVRLRHGLQPRELPPPAGTSKERAAVVADHAEGEACQDRRQGHLARQVRDVPVGGSR